ncbi:hypothetical protein GE061_015172 [Apolygus lucorum]|uniref:DUF7041 domain-containing protein n=1 Tax=Apolygus lucorum TaxID=248454 RepID=A0A8S9XPA5_APOLU|nr:hypothetical protein GE061_015172 [Apolygus lucorum]
MDIADLPKAESYISHAALKLPKFWHQDPELWFISVEAQFETARPRITRSETKLNHILAKIQPEHLREIADVLRDPTRRNYDSIKEAVIKRFGETDDEKLNKLLGNIDIGDRLPSQHLRELQRLAGPGVPNHLLRGIWLKKLPPQTQQILQTQNRLEHSSQPQPDMESSGNPDNTHSSPTTEPQPAPVDVSQLPHAKPTTTRSGRRVHFPAALRDFQTS